MITNTPATVFNRYRDELGRERWRRTILRDVFWNSSQGAQIEKSGFRGTGTLKCMISAKVFAEGREYMPPSAYESEPEKERHWTLGENDRLVRGAIEEDYEDIRDMEKSHVEVFRPEVVEVKDFGSRGGRHIRVTGR